jgi:hypothetical protein
MGGMGEKMQVIENTGRNWWFMDFSQARHRLIDPLIPDVVEMYTLAGVYKL